MSKDMITLLRNDIDNLRKKLVTSVLENGFQHPITIKNSQDLDELIYQYQLELKMKEK